MTENNGKVVVVAGATGHQGGAVARRLLAGGFTVKGLTRTPESPASEELSRRGVRMIKCDLNDAASVRAALGGAWGAFGVFATTPEGPQREEIQAVNFAHQAKAAGLRYYVYSSVASAHRKTGVPHFENKWRVENAVRGMDFESYTILRPAFFMENFVSPWFWPEITRGKLSLALKPETRLQMIAVEDIGSFAGMAFENASRFNRAEVELAGDELAMPQVAGILGAALDIKVQFKPLRIEELRKTSPDMAAMYEWFDRGGLNVDLERVRKEYNFQPMTFSRWAAKVKWPIPVNS
ncbi:MAG: NmrA/HSCARG family protein [Elusimicrobiales bacterium]|jgi:uncharacterized protein YbjT (DUF2867 family)